MLDEEMFEVRGVSNISSCDNATTSRTHAHVRTAVPSHIVAFTLQETENMLCK